MTEGKAGPRSPRVRDGWESDSSPDTYRNYSSPGVGATTGDHARPPAGAGNTGGARGTDYPEPDAVTAADQPEYPPEGWGEPGENYPPTQGPLGDEYESRDRPPRRRD